jgi:predicted amidohydrolase
MTKIVPTGNYHCLALQIRCDAVNELTDRSLARERMTATLDRARKQIVGSKAFIGPDTKLVVLPEYFLTGFPMGETVQAWISKACLEMEGPEYEAMGRIAEETHVYLAGSAYEVDGKFPGLYFQTSFVVAPSGNVVLRYRRLISMFAPTPHDIWERYLDVYGLEGVFPVARTEIGNLAAIASEEILYPEVARCMAMRGAEIFVHSSSETGSPLLTQKGVAKQARAIENLAYVVSANSAGIAHIDIPVASADGGSAIIDYKGTVLAEAAQGESMVANAQIDLGALREYRRRPGMGNLLSRQRFELFAQSYAEHSFHPPNTLLDENRQLIVPDRAQFARTQMEIIERLVDKEVI